MLSFGKSGTKLFGGGSSSSSSSSAPAHAPSGKEQKGLAPLLLHFDVNKTVIQSDSIQMKTIEEGIREGIAELFWGKIRREKNQTVWVWSKNKPSCNPPVDDDGHTTQVTYAQYCKMVVKDKADRKEVIKSFKLVQDLDCKEEMMKVLAIAMKRMELPPEVRYTKPAEDCGLNATTIMMFPTIFHFVAALQRSKRTFAILFRSFGKDHENIRGEWNAFCEMKHPLYSSLIQGVGPLDGSVMGVPDRRIHSMHTLYRDANGPVLILNKFTNGPEGKNWDDWAKEKPKAKHDTRNGRDYINKVLKAQTVDGMANLQKWMKNHLMTQATAAIKDDWAWWTWNDECASAGKLLTVIGGREDTKQLMFDDNVDYTDARIVDCRGPNGEVIAGEFALNKLCTKVNPVEALLDNEYFLRKLQVCHGEHLQMGNSLIDFQKQLAEVEDQKAYLTKQVKTLNQQLKNLTEENQRMKLLHRVNVRDEAELKELLAQQEFDLEQFGKNAYRPIKDLFSELDQGHCWLEQDEKGLCRIFEMLFVKICYKDLVLIESHEQDSAGAIQSRNYLPGVRKSLRDASFQEPLNRWIESGLNVNLKMVLNLDQLPIFTPEAPQQETHSTQAYPIRCKIQQSQATFFIPERALSAHKELLAEIGLPSGKHFMIQEKAMHSGQITRFFRWERLATWEATNRQVKNTVGGEKIDIAQVCAKIFGGHPRKEVYENLLLQMFESFTAKKLCGGFSGSVVIRCQPFDSDDRPSDPCIVKLDAGEAIREEFINSNAVFAALPDRAARIIGDAVYARNKDNEEFGAMRLELAGACWNVPELAHSSANLLFTFKDLLLYESEQILLGSNAIAGERPFGNVNTVLAETFGPGGVVSSLRKGGNGLRRHPDTNLLWGWYTLKGKEGKYNPYTAKGEYAPEVPMRQLYRKYFDQEMPDLKTLVVDTIKPQLMSLSDRCGKTVFRPLVGLAHGDLNAANIMIDALDAVWLIDFATSVELPLFTDMCKFEMACLFEYATIPITPQTLLDFASKREEMWNPLCVGDWLRVDQEVAVLLMRELVRLPSEIVSNMSQSQLDNVINDVASKNPKPHKQRQVVRALKARLTVSEDEMKCAFKYCATISQTLLKGEYLLESLQMKGIPELDQSLRSGAQGAVSLRFFLDIAQNVRRFMVSDVLACMRDWTKGNIADADPSDATSLNLWLPFLRESYRIIGYKDISPQQKCWSIYHCEMVARQVLYILDKLKNASSLRSLPIMDNLKVDMSNRKMKQATPDMQKDSQRGPFWEADSYWIYGHRDTFQPHSLYERFVRKVHAVGSLMYSGTAGFFSPIYEVWTPDEELLNIEFDDRPPNGQNAMSVFMKAPQEIAQSGVSVYDSLIKDGIGWLTRPSASKEPPVLILKSRLLLVTSGLMQAKLGSLCATGNTELSSDFDLFKWCGREIAELTVGGGAAGSARRSSVSVRSKDFSNASPTPKSRADGGLVLPEDVDMCKFMILDAVVKDNFGKELGNLNFAVGCPTLCYPPGCQLCTDASIVPLGRSGSPEVIVYGIGDSGVYKIRDAHNAALESERDFDPTCQNHVFLTSPNYQYGQRVLVSCDKNHAGHGNWMDAEIIGVADTSTGYIYRVQISNLGKLETRRSNSFDATNSESTSNYIVAASEKKGPAEEPKIVYRHLNTMNSGIHWLHGPTYEEEVSKMKGYYRSRHSFIIDALGGMKLDVKACAVPTIHLKNASQGDLKTSVSGDSIVSMRRNFRSLTRSVSFATTNQTVDVMDARHGWNLVTSAVERYNKKEPSCQPNAFLVLGSPGSGKSCMIARLIVDCSDNLVPLLLPIADLVKRSTGEESMEDLSQAQVQNWFDKYLRLTFGEDSQRYKMIRQAMSMHRVMFLIEGLEDGAAMMPLVERLVKDLVLDRHLCIVTSRPLLAGSCILEDMPEYISVMELQHLTHEQRKAVAHARLGMEGLPAFDMFFQKLRQSQDAHRAPGQGQAEEDDESGGSEDVFGNPMMLSMLICYLQMRQEESKKVDHTSERQQRHDTGEESGSVENVTLTAVYRVALDVMLQRVQSKHQADRHNKDAKVAQCKKILGKMAMLMQLMQQQEIDEDLFDKEITKMKRQEKGIEDTWKVLKSAVVAGHAMFLRMSVDGEKRRTFRFLVKGFQNFFAAQHISANGGGELPQLVPLITNPWWSSMLEMLAEAWPYQYVRHIESAHDKFIGEHGESFLHLCAKVRHRPVFQELKRFSESYQAQLHARDAERRTPLHVASEQGCTRICSYMIEKKAQLDASDAKERLPMHVAMQHGHFTTAKFLLDKYMEEKQDGKASKKRAPKDGSSLDKLAQRVLAINGHSLISEEDFKAAVNDIFPELSFFGKNETAEKKKTIGSVLAVYWIAANQYEQFVRGQPLENRLKKPSWEKLQDWTRQKVGLTNHPDTVGSMLVLVAIMRMGLIQEFKKAFAPDFEDPTGAMAHILQRFPVLVPSFAKLDEGFQNLAISALKADFNFGQFLQAENLPASLTVVKEVLNSSGAVTQGTSTKGATVLGFLLFRIFAGLCSVMSVKSLEGSLFMSEVLYNNFKVGLDVLQHLNDESAHEVYNRFLKTRAADQGLKFIAEDKESRACVRLACLARTFAPNDAEDVADAFRKLNPEERASLADFLNADGIKEKGFLLYQSPQFLENVKNNVKLHSPGGKKGLVHCMRILLKVYQTASAEYTEAESQDTTDPDSKTVTIVMEDLVNHGKTCDDLEVFQFTKFTITKTAGRKAESQGSLHLSPWQIQNNPDVKAKLEDEADMLVTDVQVKLLREPRFNHRLPQVFPELKFYALKGADRADDEVKVLRRTIGAMLSVYWVAGDQLEAFSRGQNPSQKLSANSWNTIHKWTESGLLTNELLHAVFAATAISSLGLIPKFRDQLAPGVQGGHKQVLDHVMRVCPKVLPTYWRLSEKMRNVVRLCLSTDFSFRSFARAEGLPASLTTIKEMLKDPSVQDLADEVLPAHGVEPANILDFYLFYTFAELAGCMGNESLEGSLYMTDDRFKHFHIGHQALKLLWEGQSEQVVYDKVLEKHAEELGLSFNPASLESRAIARLANLAKINQPQDALKVPEAFKDLDPKERKELTRYLNADGIKERPAFILYDSPAFLEKARLNQEVGLVSALKILLKVYDAAAKEFNGSSRSVITIQLGKLVGFAQEFFGSVQFQDLPFDLHRSDEESAVVIPKLWIPVTNPTLLDTMRKDGLDLAQTVLKKRMTEDQFKARIGRTFPELSYFPANAKMASKRDQTSCAMLSIYWLLTGQHEAFVQCQGDDDVLSKQSWAWIQEWMTTHVKLSSEKAVDAMLVFMAINGLGAIQEFREELAAGSDAHLKDVALAQILQAQPQVVPSFARLASKHQQLIVDCLSVDFQFHQFLQAENTPANLVVIKEKLRPHGEDGLSFFCFGIFAKMCGKLGYKGLKGSMFMTESQFQRFRPGLDALQQLMTLDATSAYNAFLLLRGSQAMSRFASPEHQALARLLCLASAFNPEDGDAVCDAFKDLAPEERRELTKWFNMDGIDRHPAYVLSGATSLLQTAKANSSVGITAALRMLLKVQERCTAAGWPASGKVIVKFSEVTAWAEEAGPAEDDFLKASVSVRSEVANDVRVVVVEVEKPVGTSARRNSGKGGAYEGCSCSLVFTSLAMLLLSLSFAGLALCFFFDPGPVRRAVPADVKVHIMPRRFGAASGALAALFVICVIVRCSSGCQRRLSSGGYCGGSFEPLLNSGYARLRQEDDENV